MEYAFLTWKLPLLEKGQTNLSVGSGGFNFEDWSVENKVGIIFVVDGMDERCVPSFGWVVDEVSNGIDVGRVRGG